MNSRRSSLSTVQGFESTPGPINSTRTHTQQGEEGQEDEGEGIHVGFGGFLDEGPDATEREATLMGNTSAGTISKQPAHSLSWNLLSSQSPSAISTTVSRFATPTHSRPSQDSVVQLPVSVASATSSVQQRTSSSSEFFPRIVPTRVTVVTQGLGDSRSTAQARSRGTASMGSSAARTMMDAGRRQSDKQPGQRNRCTIEDLPAAMRHEFQKYGAVIINAKRLTASLAPFANPSAEEAQLAMDEVFPNANIHLEKGNAYYENILSRLREWRNEIGATGVEGADLYVNSTVAAIQKRLRLSHEEWDEDVKSELTDHITSYLGDVNDKNRPFWWREWNETGKRVSSTVITSQAHLPPINSLQGRFKSFVILYVFGAHLEACDIRLNSKLAQYCEAPPIGAMILSILSAERGLALYREGEKKLPVGMGRWFSIENWRDGDQVDHNGAQIKIQRIYHLSKYLEKFSTEEWASVMQDALELRAEIQANRRTRKGKHRSAIVDISPEEEQDDDWDYNLQSDPIEPTAG
ncbi:hypothetical protein BDY19DRAFT_978770 [Irpex rosettiformis]|uniref:Uncharacterized protein n=1 Tax=Irpex rosettiformis TaxID=378272 RepID=A0ACB8TN22_9APHY|nr:hypothetical protein BDY19DRAFT_978770 [Irpex rosettiformis]